MKRPLQLSLAIALALGVTDVLALGLGPVRVHSRLNQPLNAEIPVIQSSPGEAEGLLVTLAGAEEFERIGLSRARLGVPLKFELDKDASGAPVIKVTSDEPVRQSYLDFLVEANWPKGRLLREYTVLLDPPVTAPARSVATTPAAPPARTPAAPPAATAPMREPPAPVAAPRSPAPAAASAAAAGEYGPVASGQTLSQIARMVRPDDDLNRAMLALFKANPSAFYKDNINALKRGAILRVPSADELSAVGSAADAAAQVRAQIEDWRGIQAAPTRVADAASMTPGAGVAGSAGGASERLELVPPRAGQDSLATADRPGDGGSAATGALKAELARTREALGSEQQESKELKSRVKELEDLKTKNERLLSLKDSEIADLQRKLQELRTATAGTAQAAPSAEVAAAGEQAPAAAAAGDTSTAAATTAAEPIGKDDIWGTGESEASAPADAAHDGAAEAGTTAGEAATGEAATQADTLAATPEGAAASGAESAPADGASGTPAAGETADSSAAALAQTPAQPVAAPEAPSGSGAESAPGGSVPAPVQPDTSMGPWYMQAWIKPAALIAGILVLLAAWFGMRRRRQAPAARSSIADAFGDSPLPAGAAGAGLDQEEAELLARLEDHPHDAGLHLELLSVYYARRDVEAFEIAASQMHDIVGEEHQAEWLEAQAMGQELAPHNPLFAVTGEVDEADGSAYSDAEIGVSGDAEEDAARPEPPPADVLANLDDEPPPTHAYGQTEERRDPSSESTDEVGGFGLDHEFGTEAPVAAEFDQANPFGDLPPIAFEAEPTASTPDAVADEVGDRLAEIEPEPMPPTDIEAEAETEVDEFAGAATLDDDFLGGVDAVATKLDLARAYMDMGDPEGARSMLEEVVAEGDEGQKAEAQRLIGELG